MEQTIVLGIVIAVVVLLGVRVRRFVSRCADPGGGAESPCSSGCGRCPLGELRRSGGKPPPADGC